MQEQQQLRSRKGFERSWWMRVTSKSTVNRFIYSSVCTTEYVYTKLASFFYVCYYSPPTTLHFGEATRCRRHSHYRRAVSDSVLGIKFLLLSIHGKWWMVGDDDVPIKKLPSSCCFIFVFPVWFVKAQTEIYKIHLQRLPYFRALPCAWINSLTHPQHI